MKSRPKILEALAELQEVSVLVIGGGVNGIGAFRDLALQGLDVLLVERSDFCSGASAASSHMAHGGVRYLENGEFRLVREAVQERNRLIRNAPHYVRPLSTTIPVFKIFSGLLNAPLKFLGLLDRPAERGALVIKIGLMLYDAYTRRQEDLTPGLSIRPHEIKSRAAALAETPGLNPDVLFTATYTDGSIEHPERLCLEMILDALEANPQALAVNYMSAGGLEDGRVLLRDEVGGMAYAVRPRVVVNAAGPWIDFANEALGLETRYIGGTKGSHLVLDHPVLRQAIGESEFFFENQDGRIVLIFPWKDKVLVGTSDLRIEDPDDARCTEAEVDYFLDMIARVFPGMQVDKSQVVFTFSGVRPLPAAEAASTGQISRDHSIRAAGPETGLPFPVYSLVGGKWTTFRAFSEQVADKVLEALGQERRTSTRAVPIGGGMGYPHGDREQSAWLSSLHQGTGVPLERLRVLFERYGTYSARIADFIAAGQDQPLRHLPAYSRREIGYLVLQEAVVRLDDLLLRRSLMGMLGEVDMDLLKEIAGLVSACLGWDAVEKERQIRLVRTLFADRHGVDLA